MTRLFDMSLIGFYFFKCIFQPLQSKQFIYPPKYTLIIKNKFESKGQVVLILNLLEFFNYVDQWFYNIYPLHRWL